MLAINACVCNFSTALVAISIHLMLAINKLGYEIILITQLFQYI